MHYEPTIEILEERIKTLHLIIKDLGDLVDDLESESKLDKRDIKLLEDQLAEKDKIIEDANLQVNSS